jgi:hypothetical protein
MSNAVADVVVAAAQSVGMVFLVGAVGFFAVQCKSQFASSFFVVEI